jgi:PhoPQ-activated pathogenicity-related protein
VKLSLGPRIAVGLALLLAAPALAAETVDGALAAYVNKPDESFRWTKRREGALGTGTFAELIVTSQTWRDIPWRHQLFIIKPPEVAGDGRALLFITGGRWREELADPVADESKESLPREAALLAAAAATAKSPIAVLLHVPQQPILGGLVEDAAISYTFDQYLKTQDPEWPLLLPMVKSAVKGMDAVQQFAQKEWSLDVKSFTVTGASKRGWTTWLTGAVDKRATALVPMVIDVLNMQPQMKHQLETWGKFSEQIHDYTERNIQARVGTEVGDRLNRIVDPYTYRAAYTQPKLIMLGTNDRYWPLDALNLYWDGLPGDKYICYVPNNGHGLKDVPRIVGGLSAMHKAASGRLKLPKLTWDLAEKDGKLSLAIKSDTPPAKTTAWIASAETKDFRDAQWRAESTETIDGAYCYRLPVPEKGYAALFGEAVFEDGGTPFFLSTNVKIVGGKK